MPQGLDDHPRQGIGSSFGVVGVRPIDGQNRPTFQQAVHVTSHR